MIARLIPPSPPVMFCGAGVRIFFSSPRSHKKPLAPTCTVQIATSGSDEDSTPKPVPIHSAGFCPDKQSVVLYYGSSMQPLIEKVVGYLETPRGPGLQKG